MIKILIFLLAADFSGASMSGYQPPDSEKWFVGDLRVELETPHPDLKIMDQDRLVISGAWPYIGLGGLSSNQAAKISEKLKRAIAPDLPESAVLFSAEHLAFVHRTWFWVEDLVREEGTKAKTLTVAGLQVFPPREKTRSLARYWSEEISRNFKACRDGKFCDDRRRRLAIENDQARTTLREFGKGRSTTGALPSPLEEAEYGIYRGQLIRLKKRLSFQSNPRYQPERDHNQPPRDFKMQPCPEC